MGNIGAIILAAGMSQRMGQPKQLIPFLGKPLFRHAIEAAITAGLKPIVLVGGKQVEELLQHVAHLEDIEVIENRDYQSGMASSLKMGIQALTGRADAAVVYLADQPLLPSIVTEKILENYRVYRKEGIRILRPEYNGTAGHPILFDADLFEAFGHIQGDEGAKSILVNHHSRLQMISFPKSEWGMDIDTPDDLMELVNIAVKGELTHFNEQGRARMVDISSKECTHRTATAKTTVRMKPPTLKLIKQGKISKGDVLAVAQVAGIMAAKKTFEWIPMCHPILISGIDIRFSDNSDDELYIEGTVMTTGPTGVEMEALIAVSAAALTVYDMCKSVEKEMVIGATHLLSKNGGKSGNWQYK